MTAAASDFQGVSACALAYDLPSKIMTQWHVVQVPIYVRALDYRHAAELEAAGADYVTTATTEAGIALGSRMLQELGGRDNDIAGLTRALRKQLESEGGEARHDK